MRRWHAAPLLVVAGLMCAGVLAGVVSARPERAGATNVVWLKLKPDNWGTTVAIGTKELRAQYQGIVRATCQGVRMIDQPKKESTWVSKGKRWWDKLYCSGAFGSGSQFFTLVFDPRGRDLFKTYRLQNVTLTQLRTKPSPVHTPTTPPPTTPPARPTPPAPTPPPSDTATTLLIDQAMNQVINTGRTFQGLQDSAGTYYYWQAYRNECARLSGDTARCWLYLWKQINKQDANFNIYVARYIFRINVFAVDLGRGAYHTFSSQADYDTVWRTVCSDVAAEGAPRCT
jgi:hypothetical protein